jgi:hypothetical protein
MMLRGPSLPPRGEVYFRDGGNAREGEKLKTNVKDILSVKPLQCHCQRQIFIPLIESEREKRKKDENNN